MKQMTKEELIEYFIEQLGDNEILGQVMTIEQIRQKLNSLIRQVTYNPEMANFCASWNVSKQTINFDLQRMPFGEEDVNIVHELIHVLSSSEIADRNPNFSAYIYSKVGLHYYYSMKKGHERRVFSEDNRAINEGITDFLADKITGKIHKGYQEEKDIYRVLSIVTGEGVILKKYFADIAESFSIKEIEHNVADIFKEDLIQKYGLQVGIKLNDDVKKVLSLADQLNGINTKDSVYGINENGNNIRRKIQNEISNTLVDIIERVIDNEPDFTKKFALISKLQDVSFFSFDSRRIISRKVESELINSKEFSYTQKVEMINTLRTQGVKFDLQTIEDMIFNLPEVQQFNPAEKLEYGMNLLNGYMLTKNSMSIFYRLYVECGKINDERFPKKEIIWRTLEISSFNTPQEIEKQLNEARYYELGEYYVLPRGEHPDNTVIFDEEGKLLKPRKIDIDPLEDNVELICDEMDRVPSINRFSEDKVKKISEQLKEKFEQFRISAKGECEDRGIAIIGNILRLYYVDWEEKTESEQSFLDFYSIDEDGILHLIPKRH